MVASLVVDLYTRPLNVVHRLLFVGVQAAVPEREWLRMQLGLGVVVIYLIALLYCKPFKRDDIDKLDVAMAPMRGLGRYSIVDAVPAGSGHAATLDQACA